MFSVYLSRGNIINATITMKKTTVKRKKPFVVWQPDGPAMSMYEPKIDCRNLAVSGLATRKKTSAL